MAYITSSLTIIITFISVESVTSYSQDYNYNPYTKTYTTQKRIKQGRIQGVIVGPKMNGDLPAVEHYRGIPYAAPPVGDLRFMPPREAPSWQDVKYADNFGPVCPQTFPDVRSMSPERKEKFLRLKNYLMDQSEDCLYLNIYAPYNHRGIREENYPVVVFIHGESFEWNSGNPYDGSVLAAYGKVIVITFNFRLGILGFLKTGIGEEYKANFGLVDQIAALVWIRENVEAFGGDSKNVTLIGHGTGAVCASLLTLSPMVLPGNELLFHRAILMGGTALADWALASNPQEVTYQVARALNCPTGDEFEACLRSKRLDEIMNISVFSRPYSTRFGPVVDSRIVPNDPLQSMTNFTTIFRRFDLMYGVTEMESTNFLGPIAMVHGMLQRERDEELRNYLRFTCQTKPESCVTNILTEYTGNLLLMDDEAFPSGSSPTAYIVRDSLLDILSDARVVAPMLKMAKFHSEVNPRSYFYLFTHKTESNDYLRNKTSSGDELPYIFGVPLDGGSFHFTDRYTESEILFSEVIMTYVCNFAYGGNPNNPRKTEYYTETHIDWTKFDVDWPNFNDRLQKYLQLDIPLKTSSHYRADKFDFWNERFPNFLEESKRSNIPFEIPVTSPPLKRPKGTPPFIFTHHFGHVYTEPRTDAPRDSEDVTRRENEVFGKVITTATDGPSEISKPVYGTIVNSSSELQKATTMNLIVISGCSVLFAFLLLFTAVYYKCYKSKKDRSPEIINNEIEGDLEGEKKNQFEENQAFVSNGCGLMKMISKSSKSDDVYEAVKIGSLKSEKHKLVRQLSTSTIDANTKVRDWMAQEVNKKFSPKGIHKLKYVTNRIKNKTSQDEIQEMISWKTDSADKKSTLGRCPTRPVSPIAPMVDNLLKVKPVLVKQSSLPTQYAKKPSKVSVAVDATPSGRGPSVLAQQPIELTKSLDFDVGLVETPLRRSVTLDDFSTKDVDSIMNPTKSVNNLTSSRHIPKTTLVKISHSHSKSDPVDDTYVASKTKKLRTFDPNADVNVTSRDEVDAIRPLSPEESLMTIKRRNYPKVLPDLPRREAMAQKRMSMPAANLSIPVNDLRNKLKIPPAPPVRTTSTLGRKPQNSVDHLICTSAPVLLEEGSSSPEPEITYNNYYMGPIIPKKLNTINNDILDTNPIYSSLNALKRPGGSTDSAAPIAIVTTDPTQPIKKPEPKTVIRPKMVRQSSDPKARVIPRVTASDNLPGLHQIPKKTEKSDNKIKDVENKSDSDKCQLPKPTMIPTFSKTPNIVKKDPSSSDTSPSEESDTETVVKRL